MWSSASATHLLQGSTSCIFRDALLKTWVVTAGYLGQCNILDSLLQPPIVMLGVNFSKSS